MNQSRGLYLHLKTLFKTVLQSEWIEYHSLTVRPAIFDNDLLVSKSTIRLQYIVSNGNRDLWVEVKWTQSNVFPVHFLWRNRHLSNWFNFWCVVVFIMLIKLSVSSEKLNFYDFGILNCTKLYILQNHVFFSTNFFRIFFLGPFCTFQLCNFSDKAESKSA